MPWRERTGQQTFFNGDPRAQRIWVFFLRTRSEGTACLTEKLSLQPEYGSAREIRKRAREETRDTSLR